MGEAVVASSRDVTGVSAVSGIVSQYRSHAGIVFGGQGWLCGIWEAKPIVGSVLDLPKAEAAADSKASAVTAMCRLAPSCTLSRCTAADDEKDSVSFA